MSLSYYIALVCFGQHIIYHVELLPTNAYMPLDLLAYAPFVFFKKNLFYKTPMYIFIFVHLCVRLGSKFSCFIMFEYLFCL